MSLALFELEGKRALITGGTQGIGNAIAKGLGKAGVMVIIIARNPEKMNQSVKVN